MDPPVASGRAPAPTPPPHPLHRPAPPSAPRCDLHRGRRAGARAGGRSSPATPTAPLLRRSARRRCVPLRPLASHRAPSPLWPLCSYCARQKPLAPGGERAAASDSPLQPRQISALLCCASCLPPQGRSPVFPYRCVLALLSSNSPLPAPSRSTSSTTWWHSATTARLRALHPASSSVPSRPSPGRVRSPPRPPLPQLSGAVGLCFQPRRPTRSSRLRAPFLTAVLTTSAAALLLPVLSPPTLVPWRHPHHT